MRRLVLSCVVAVGVVVGGLIAAPRPQIAGAATATPTRTPTPTKTPAAGKTPTPTPAPPPKSLPERFYGTVTWFGKPLAKATTFEALVAGTVCGTGTFKSGSFVVDVKAEVDQAGCGVAGVPVTFRVDGMLANETAAFTTGAPSSLDLTGPRMASVTLASGSGCNNVASTYPSKTPVATIRDAVLPAEALTAIWRWNSTTGQWEADVPGVALASTLKTVDFADPLWICVGVDAQLTQPEVS